MIDGSIHRHLVGKRIRSAYKDGQHLIIALEDGHELRIAWCGEDGKPIRGEPELQAVDVKVQIPGVTLFGVGANF